MRGEEQRGKGEGEESQRGKGESDGEKLDIAGSSGKDGPT